MATNIQFTSVPSKRLAASINSSSSTIQLSDILGWDGTALSSGILGDKLYAVLRNDSNTLMEIMELDPTTIASASITILRRGLKFDGDLSTEVSANKLTWVKNETIVELGSHPPQLLNYTVRTYGDQTINDTKTFATFPQKSGVTTPTQAAELATKAYVDATATGAAAVYDQNIMAGTAGETLAAGNSVYFKESDQRWWLAKADAAATSIGVTVGIAQGTATAGNAVNVLLRGIEKNLTGLTAGSKYYISSATGGALSTAPGTFRRFVGTALSTTRLIFVPDSDPMNVKQDGREVYAADGGANDTYAVTLSPVPTAYVIGMVVKFKANTANTGTASLNVNGIGPITIKKNYDQTLADNDIKSGQIIEVVYDGTNFQMLSQLGNTQVSTKFGGSGADGALSITSGTTTIDLASAQLVVKNYTSISITGTGQLAFSNPYSNGTIVILKSQGNVTLTSSASPNIACNSLGGIGGTGSSGDADGTGGSSGWAYLFTPSGGSGGHESNDGSNAGGTSVSGGSMSPTLPYYQGSRTITAFTGSGGGQGGGVNDPTTGGAGGRGGGGLYIECGGALNFTSSISVAGANGTVGASGTRGAGGGGGGAGGSCIVLYQTLTAASGTVTISGGTGGNGGTSNGGSGAGGTGGAGGNAITGGSGTGGSSGAGGSGTNPNDGGGGGGGGGASAYSAANGSNGTNGTNSAGIGSGGGGGGGASGYYVIEQNVTFT